jgi:hypothetical protein
VYPDAVYYMWAAAVPSPHQEGRMRNPAIRLLTLGAAALVMIPTVTLAKARTNHTAYVKKHHLHRSHAFARPRAADHAWPVGRPPAPSGDVCPGIARSFDCKIWPPPIDDDPDRKISGSDGG